MAKKKLLDVDPDNPKTWVKEPQPEEIYDEEDAEIDEVFAGFPQNEPCIELFRINALKGGRPLFLEEMTPASFSFAAVTEKYGGGKYFARAKYKNGQKIRCPFEIEGDPFPVRRAPQEYQPKIPGSAGPSIGFPANFTVEQPAKELAGENTLGDILKSLVAQRDNSEMHFLQKLQIYKDLFASKSDTPIEQALTMFQKGIEMAGNIQGGSENPWLFVLRELKEPLSKALDTVQLAMKAPPKQVNPFGAAKPVQVNHPVPGQPTPAPPTQVPSEPMTDEDKLIQLQLRALLPFLINGATRNADPDAYVDVVLDQVPESAYTRLLDWLSRPDCLDQIAALEPGIRFQADWWTALRHGLIAAVTEITTDGVRNVQPELHSKPSTVDSASSDETP